MQFIIPEERQIPIFSQLVAETLTAYFTDAEVSVFHNQSKLKEPCRFHLKCNFMYFEMLCDKCPIFYSHKTLKTIACVQIPKALFFSLRLINSLIAFIIPVCILICFFLPDNFFQL